MSLKIVNAPMECATGGVSEFILLEIGPTYRYENGVRSDSVIGQTLVVGNRKTFENKQIVSKGKFRQNKMNLSCLHNFNVRCLR